MALILHWPDSSLAMNNKMAPKVMASPPKERTMVDVEMPPISKLFRCLGILTWWGFERVRLTFSTSRRRLSFVESSDMNEFDTYFWPKPRWKGKRSNKNKIPTFADVHANSEFKTIQFDGKFSFCWNLQINYFIFKIWFHEIFFMEIKERIFQRTGPRF